jgi:hypothetical protein
VGLGVFLTCKRRFSFLQGHVDCIVLGEIAKTFAGELKMTRFHLSLFVSLFSVCLWANHADSNKIKVEGERESAVVSPSNRIFTPADVSPRPNAFTCRCADEPKPAENFANTIIFFDPAKKSASVFNKYFSPQGLDFTVLSCRIVIGITNSATCGTDKGLKMKVAGDSYDQGTLSFEGMHGCTLKCEKP